MPVAIVAGECEGECGVCVWVSEEVGVGRCVARESGGAVAAGEGGVVGGGHGCFSNGRGGGGAVCEFGDGLL